MLPMYILLIGTVLMVAVHIFYWYKDKSYPIVKNVVFECVPLVLVLGAQQLINDAQSPVVKVIAIIGFVLLIVAHFMRDGKLKKK